MGILSKTANVKLWGKNMKPLLDLGYKGKKGDIIDVSIEHLPYRCRSEIEVECDMCGKRKIVNYCDYHRSVKNTGSYVCQQCIPKKAALTNLEKYGVKVVSQNDQIKQKMKKTMIEHFGTDNPMKNDEIKKRLCETNLARHGVLYPSQSEAIRWKINESYYKNGTQKTSKQQLYLCSLFGGELNYPIKYYSADICFPEENLIIEYDGSGHELNVKLGKITEEEHLQKEITRFSILKREGYKQMRIISTNDKIPKDEILLQMLSIARKYFSETSHSWINFDIDDSKIINAENRNVNGIHYDYGELRKIKEIS